MSYRLMPKTTKRLTISLWKTSQMCLDTLPKKQKVYKAIMLPSLLYEFWVTYLCHLHLHWHCLHTILKIVNNDSITSWKDKTFGIETWLCWTGHVLKTINWAPNQCNREVLWKRYGDSLKWAFVSCSTDQHKWAREATYTLSRHHKTF